MRYLIKWLSCANDYVSPGSRFQIIRALHYTILGRTVSIVYPVMGEGSYVYLLKDRMSPFGTYFTRARYAMDEAQNRVDRDRGYPDPVPYGTIERPRALDVSP